MSQMWIFLIVCVCCHKTVITDAALCKGGINLFDTDVTLYSNAPLYAAECVGNNENRCCKTIKMN